MNPISAEGRARAEPPTSPSSPPVVDEIEHGKTKLVQLSDQHSLFDDDSEPTVEYPTGILASQHIQQLIDNRYILANPGIDSDQIQPASLDLRLGATAYHVEASFLPGERGRVMNRVRDLLIEEIDLRSPTVLRRGYVYIVPLMEQLKLPDDYSAKANPKSTTGRLDIFTRLITDYSGAFESVAPGYRGPLFVEIVPKTFDVAVQQGTRLNQLRLVRGAPRPADEPIRRLHLDVGVVFSVGREKADPQINKGLWIRVDLSPRADSKIIGFKAKRETPVIDLSKVNFYDPSLFWEAIRPNKRGSLTLSPEDFYILVSKDRVSVPLNTAAEMVAYDPSFGEFRVHYAGFFDPGFGFGTNTNGTPAVLEVRSQEVPFVLEDGQTVARLVYERLLARPSKIYGEGIGSSYEKQDLTLSKQFKRPTFEYFL
jgi:dCTP deaminase